MKASRTEDGGMTRISSQLPGKEWKKKSYARGKAGGMNRLCDPTYVPSSVDILADYWVQVRLVQLSMDQKDSLTVLLTGRSESSFPQIIRRMVGSKKLEFDLICLKPEVGPNNERFATTIDFKHAFLEDLILTYEQADEVRIYEDRVKQ